MATLNKRSINKNQGRVVIALVIVILIMIVVILYRATQGVLTTTTTTSSSSNTTPLVFGKVLQVADPKVIVLGDKIITFPDGWKVANVYQNSVDSQYKCSTISSSDCRIFALTDGTNTFYISTPSFVRDTFAPAYNNVLKDLNSNNESVSFTYEQLILQKRDNNDAGATTTDATSQNLFYQVYGCFKENFCVNSLGLNFDPTQNAAQISAFENFVQQIKF